MKFLLFSSFAHLVLDRDPTRVSGGAELQMGLLARALAQRGHDVALLGADEGQPDGRVLDGVRQRTLMPLLAECTIVPTRSSKRQGAIAGIMHWLTEGRTPGLGVRRQP